MRILQVAPPWFPVPPPRYGGTELVVGALTDGLVAAGHDVTLVAAGNSRTSATLDAEYDVAPSSQLGDGLVEAAHVLHAYRARHEYDLIHDHTPLGATLAAVTDGPPVVHTVHGAWTGPLPRLYRQIADDVALVAISEDHARRAPVPLAGTVHNGIDTDRYPFGDQPSGHLVWLGRAGPDKGADLAVDVAERTGRPLRMGIKLNEHDEHTWFRAQLLPRLGHHHIDVTVNATHRQKVDMLRDAAVLLAPLRWDEPFGLVLVEAAACGTPVVAFARGAAPEIIVDGKTGVLVEPEDVDGLCAAVEVAATLDRRTCRDHVATNFSAARMLAGYLDVYDRVLS